MNTKAFNRFGFVFVAVLALSASTAQGAPTQPALMAANNSPAANSAEPVFPFPPPAKVAAAEPVFPFPPPAKVAAAEPVFPFPPPASHEENM